MALKWHFMIRYAIKEPRTNHSLCRVTEAESLEMSRAPRLVSSRIVTKLRSRVVAGYHYVNLSMLDYLGNNQTAA